MAGLQQAMSRRRRAGRARRQARVLHQQYNAQRLGAARRAGGLAQRLMERADTTRQRRVSDAKREMPVARAADRAPGDVRARERRLKRDMQYWRRRKRWWKKHPNAPDTETLQYRLPYGPPRPGVPPGRYGNPFAVSASVRSPRPRRAPLSTTRTSAVARSPRRPGLAGLLSRRRG